MKQIKWALFISGQGSNMSALLDAGEPISLVVSSRPDAYGLTRARRAGIETLVLDKKIDWDKLLAVLEERGITHIFLTGFMKIIDKSFLQKWRKPILNVHPSLLPKYPGLKSVERAMAEDAAVGVTVHRVIADVDAGESVAQEIVFPAGGYAGLSLEQVEFALHLTEYKLVRHSFKAASCWT